MRKKCVFVIFWMFSLFAFRAGAQGWEVGAFLGGSNYEGDLAPIAFQPRETHSAAGGFIRYNPARFFSFRLGLTYGVISGTDANAIDPALRQRNLSFKSNILDLALTAEWNILGYDAYVRPFSPFLFAGVAGFHFNPRALYKGEWVYLQPLGTEGQGTSAFPDRKKYPLYQVSIPVGLGVKIALADLVNMGVEIGFRKTFTDYLDDVSKTYVDPLILISENGSLANALSNRTGEYLGTPVLYGNGDQRGDPTDMDWYLFGGVTISFNLEGLNTFRGSSIGCPTHL